MAQFGFIGMGNMGYAMLNGVLGEFAPGQIIFTTPHKEKCEKISAQTGVKYAESNAECANNAKYIILAVKPQMYDAVLKNIENVITSEKVIISIAPGITIDSIKGKLGGSVRVVRAMPNTPALVGEGITAACSNENVTPEELDTVIGILRGFGKCEVVPEHLMDVVTSVSGSSPAYVFMFIEAMADGAVADGMPRAQAYEFAAQAVLGSAKMVLETGKHPGELKDMVCSPGGTTIEAVRVLEEKGMRSAVFEAMKACTRKSRGL